jgi:radical SAM enzyme (TIGR01210 family)
MCGYFNDSMRTPVSENDLCAQFEKAMKTYKDEKIVKIFTSGSFLDPNEVQAVVRKEILSVLSKRVEKISVESRPEYITEKTLSEIDTSVQPALFEIGVGLETSNDTIREKTINKGFSFADYKTAAKLLKKHHVGVKTYVLMKPPFVTEKEALEDCLHTIQDTASYTDVVSLNPVNVQRNTVVDYLWKRNQYRPPWLWSVVEFLKQSKKMTDALVKCDVVGGGSYRGPHNCGKCDRAFLDAIAQFSLSQKTSVFNDLHCDCKEQWLDQLECEQLSVGSYGDFSRWKS